MEPLAEENKKTQGGDEPFGEKYSKGPARARPCRVQHAGPRIPEGVLSGQLATAKEQLQSKSEQLITASTQLKDASEQLEKLQKVSEEKRGTFDPQKCRT